MKKGTQCFFVAAGFLGLFLAVNMLCLHSCNWNKWNKNRNFPIEIPICEPIDEGLLWPPETRGVHEIYDSLMIVYWETDSNRGINDPGSILVEAMDIDSERNESE